MSIQVLGTIFQYVETVKGQHVILNTCATMFDLPIIMSNALGKGRRHCDQLLTSGTPLHLVKGKGREGEEEVTKHT